jgi:hypothetical protein
MYTHNPGMRRLVGLITGLLLMSVGCQNDPFAPFEPEIGNTPDNFQFQVTALKNLSVARDYTWQHTGTVANVDQATSLSAGSATLIVRDAVGLEVYRKDLKANGSFQTAAGAPGQWVIRIALSNASGNVNFRVQKQ